MLQHSKTLPLLSQILLIFDLHLQPLFMSSYFLISITHFPIMRYTIMKKKKRNKVLSMKKLLNEEIMRIKKSLRIMEMMALVMMIYVSIPV